MALPHSVTGPTESKLVTPWARGYLLPVVRERRLTGRFAEWVRRLLL